MEKANESTPELSDKIKKEVRAEFNERLHVLLDKTDFFGDEMPTVAFFHKGGKPGYAFTFRSARSVEGLFKNYNVRIQIPDEGISSVEVDRLMASDDDKNELSFVVAPDATVESLKDSFKTYFGVTLRIYTGKNAGRGARFAADNLRLKDVNPGGVSFAEAQEIIINQGTTIGTFEKAFSSKCNIAVQVASPDNEELLPNRLKLRFAKDYRLSGDLITLQILKKEYFKHRQNELVEKNFDAFVVNFPCLLIVTSDTLLDAHEQLHLYGFYLKVAAALGQGSAVAEAFMEEVVFISQSIGFWEDKFLNVLRKIIKEEERAFMIEAMINSALASSLRPGVAKESEQDVEKNYLIDWTVAISAEEKRKIIQIAEKLGVAVSEHPLLYLLNQIEI